MEVVLHNIHVKVAMRMVKLLQKDDLKDQVIAIACALVENFNIEDTTACKERHEAAISIDGEVSNSPPQENLDNLATCRDQNQNDQVLDNSEPIVVEVLRTTSSKIEEYKR